ncbi:GntR family transcriptional regulator [Tistrella bauzanensis]
MTVTGDVPQALLDTWRAAVAAARGGAVYRALADAIAADIAAARLAPGASLPPQRRLAWTLDTAIATVTRAYADLSARGLITAETGRGTRVGRRRRADDGVIAPGWSRPRATRAPADGRSRAPPPARMAGCRWRPMRMPRAPPARSTCPRSTCPRSTCPRSTCHWPSRPTPRRRRHSPGH